MRAEDGANAPARNMRLNTKAPWRRGGRRNATAPAGPRSKRNREDHMRKSTKSILAGIGLVLASSTSVLAQELTIFWAEWDPANYLQELVNEYQAETGVAVTVETTPWSDFQTKAFTEFNAQG